MGQPRPLLSFIFGLFKHTSWQFLQQIYVINVHPVYSAGIQPLKHDSPPITTRPGLPFRFVINIFHDRVSNVGVVSLLGYLAPPSDPSHWLKDGDCLNQLKAKSEPRPVWQDLAIFESPRWRTFLQKLPKYIKVFLGFFENINFQVTIAVATFGVTLEKFWRLFISALVTLVPSPSFHRKNKPFETLSREKERNFYCARGWLFCCSSFNVFQSKKTTKPTWK